MANNSLSYVIFKPHARSDREQARSTSSNYITLEAGRLREGPPRPRTKLSFVLSYTSVLIAFTNAACPVALKVTSLKLSCLSSGQPSAVIVMRLLRTSYVPSITT